MPQGILLAQRALADSLTPHIPIQSTSPGTDSDAGISPYAHKSTGKAFLMNLAIPGAGHLYAGEKRGYLHLGAEGFAWAAYLYYHDRGKAREKEFETYADGHWDYQQWVDSCQCSGSDEDLLIRNFRDNNRQQYYEDIGKISTYWDGWDSQDNRNFYRGIRAHSNNLLKNAHTAVAGAFVNRIVSAVDVLRVMKHRGSHASLGKQTQIKFKMRTKPFARDNAFGFVVTKRLN
jgi:hypothetical protein